MLLLLYLFISLLVGVESAALACMRSFITLPQASCQKKKKRNESRPDRIQPLAGHRLISLLIYVSSPSVQHTAERKDRRIDLDFARKEDREREKQRKRHEEISPTEAPHPPSSPFFLFPSLFTTLLHQFTRSTSSSWASLEAVLLLSTQALSVCLSISICLARSPPGID